MSGEPVLALSRVFVCVCVVGEGVQGLDREIRLGRQAGAALGALRTLGSTAQTEE